MSSESRAVPQADAGQAMRSVTGDAFDQLMTQSSGPVVVEFMSYSCEYCRVLAPILERVARMSEFKGRFFMVNVAVEERLAAAYEIRATPTLLMFLNGRIVGRVEGVRPTVSSVLTAVTRPFRAVA